MMASSDVIEVLSLLNDAGLTAWVDGGWGVDALLGEATREHADLDLVVLEPRLAAVRWLLSQAGYASVLRDLLPASVAVADGQGHEVDLHPVTPTPAVAATRPWRMVGASTTRHRCKAASMVGRSAASTRRPSTHTVPDDLVTALPEGHRAMMVAA